MKVETINYGRLALQRQKVRDHGPDLYAG